MTRRTITGRLAKSREASAIFVNVGYNIPDMKGVMRASMAQESRTGRHEFIPLRERITQRWVQRRMRRIGHERRVTAIATTMFDLMRELHGMGAPQRRVLRLATMLHDVGRCVDNRRHPALGAEMILEDE